MIHLAFDKKAEKSLWLGSHFIDRKCGRVMSSFSEMGYCHWKCLLWNVILSVFDICLPLGMTLLEVINKIGCFGHEWFVIRIKMVSYNLYNIILMVAKVFSGVTFGHIWSSIFLWWCLFVFFCVLIKNKRTSLKCVCTITKVKNGDSTV